MKEKHKAVDMASPLETFQHTHIAVYLCGLFAVACICYDSIQVQLSITWRCSSLTLQQFSVLRNVRRASCKSMLSIANGSTYMVRSPICVVFAPRKVA